MVEEGSGVSPLLMFLQLPGVCLLSEGKHVSLFPLWLFGKETALGLCRTIPLFLAASVSLWNVGWWL